MTTFAVKQREGKPELRVVAIHCTAAAVPFMRDPLYMGCEADSISANEK